MKFAKFHLRDLFWLVLVAALGCGWWVQRREIVALEEHKNRWESRAKTARLQADNAVEELRKLGCSVMYIEDGVAVHPPVQLEP